GELGILTRAFNQMLSRIQEQDQAINFSQRKIEALINSIESIVWERDPATFHFSFVSTQCQRILGYTPGQWMADPNFWQAHLHPEDAPAVLQKSRMRREAPLALVGKSYCDEYRMMAANGRFVWIRESGSVLIKKGKLAAIRGIFLDVTAQKAAADELERLNRRLVETS